MNLQIEDLRKPHPTPQTFGVLKNPKPLKQKILFAEAFRFSYGF